MGPSSSRRVRGSNRVLVVCGAPASLRESRVARRAPSLQAIGSPWSNGSVGIARSVMALLGVARGLDQPLAVDALISSTATRQSVCIPRYPPRLPSRLIHGWFSFRGLLRLIARALAGSDRQRTRRACRFGGSHGPAPVLCASYTRRCVGDPHAARPRRRVARAG
jgi:hypothetical protein